MVVIASAALLATAIYSLVQPEVFRRSHVAGDVEMDWERHAYPVGTKSTKRTT